MKKCSRGVRNIIMLIFLLEVVISFRIRGYSQEQVDNEPKNVLYGSVGNLLLWFTTNVNYERLLTTTDEDVFSRYYLHAGFGGYASWTETGRSTDLSFRWLGGRRNSHFELGLGLLSLFDKQGYDLAVNNTLASEPEPSRGAYRNILPAATLGYRFQKPEGGFVFRTGIASPDGVYLSIGYAF